MNTLLRCPAALLALAAAAVTPAAGQDDALRQRLQVHLDSLHAAGTFPGVTLGVALPDGSVLALSAGLADTTLRQPLPTDARMLAGSTGKTFVAAVALQLVGEGRLDLAARIERWLGSETWFARLPNARDITVRQLMNHTSGLVRYEFDPRVAAILTRDPDHVWTPEERLSFLLDTDPPFAAGAGWDYSDTNYIVLGMIIERITGSTLYDEVRRRVLEPLQLRGTIPSDRRELPGVVQGYAGPQNPFGGRDAMIEDGRFIVNPQMEWAGGGFATTAADLARWAWLLYQGRAFPAALLPVMLDGVPARLGGDARYGLGVIIRTTPLGTGLGHSGFFPGYSTDMRYYPDLQIAVALQFNTSVGRAIGRSPSAALDSIAAIVAGAVR
jgi:D-alanyl-D-alanine carboxypeptidase